MKKIFTLLSGLLLASGLTANAEEITINVCDGDGKSIAEPVTTQMVKDLDGNYIIKSFMWAGKPLSFKFDQPEIGKWSPIVITSPTEVDEGYEAYKYLMDAEGNYLSCYLENLNEEEGWLNVVYPYIYTDAGKYSYVYRYDTTDPDNTYEYYARFSFSGDYFYGYNEETYEYDIAKATPWVYLTIWFNEPEVEIPGQVEFTVKTWGYNAEKEEDAWIETGESFKTVLTANEDQSITIEDFFRSGSPVTFDFATPQPWKFTTISFPDADVTEGWEAYPYLLDKEGKFLTCWNIPIAGGEKEPIYNTYVDNSTDKLGTPKSYLYDQEDNDYFLCIYVSGYADDNNPAPTYQLTTSFNMELKLKGDDSAVAGVEVDENAPVEYYNLNGQKVQNPANGIFIRKQGAKASKVVIR